MSATVLKRSSRRGYGSLIGILLALVIVAVLMYEGYLSPDKITGDPKMVAAKEKAKDSGCDAERFTAKSTLVSAIIGGDSDPAPAVIRAKFKGKFRCPGEGKLEFDRDGNVYCTLHSPTPEHLQASVFDLE